VEETLVQPPTVRPTTPAPSTSPPPTLIFVVQKTESLPHLDPSIQQTEEVRVTAEPKPTLFLPPVKQILHLDDYDVEFGEEDELENIVSTQIAPTVVTMSTVASTPVQQNPTRKQPSMFDIDDDETDDEEEEEEDLFFWKPDYDPRRPTVATSSIQPTSEDPFQIVAHRDVRATT